MLDLILNVPNIKIIIIIFIVITVLKIMLETFAVKKNGKGGIETSKAISIWLIIMYILSSALIITEIILFKHFFPTIILYIFVTDELLLMVIKFVCIKNLGVYYSIHLRITEKHRLIKSGIYRYMRNPMYLIIMLDSAVYPLIFGAYHTAFLCIILICPIVICRIIKEEEALLKKFGDEYEEYRKKTWF